MSAESENVRERIQSIKTLPTMPGVVNKLMSMVESDDASVAQVGELVASDQVIAAKVLRIVNSPFYGFPGRITTVNHALVLLGFDVIRGIVLSAGVIDYMAGSLMGLWEHSIGVATASGKIARAVGAPEPEEISTAGLLHDLGKVILSVELPRECDKVVAEAERSGIPFIEAERRCLDGITHCDIADWLAQEWHLSRRLREPITLHHRPEAAETVPAAVAVVHLADIVTHALQFGSGGDPFVPNIAPFAMRTLNLKMSDLARLIEAIDEELEGLDTSAFS